MVRNQKKSKRDGHRANVVAAVGDYVTSKKSKKPRRRWPKQTSKVSSLFDFDVTNGKL